MSGGDCSAHGIGTVVSNRLTLLRAHDGPRGPRRLTKRFCVATNGRVAASPYDNAKFFTAEAVAVSGVRDLHRLLRGIEGDPQCCVIRGEAVAGTNLSLLQRKKAENGGAFAEAPRAWVMLDLDGGVPLPPGCSVLADPGEAARAVLDILAAHAPELEGVGAVVQFSSSAGLDEVAAGEAAVSRETGVRRDWSGVAKPGLRAHIWYWLASPHGEAALKRWIEGVAAAGLALDPATVRTVQPHYTAAPVFDPPLRDSLAGRRTVLVEGAADAAELDIPAPDAGVSAWAQGASAQAGRGYLGHLDAIGPEGFHAPVLRAASAFVAANWPDPDLDALRGDLRAAVLAADPGGRTAAEIADRAGDRHLDGIIAWVVGQERRKRAAQAAEAAAAAAAAGVEPTYPDRGIPLDDAAVQAAAVVERFAERVAAGEKPELLLRKTVGAGKSDVVVRKADVLHAAGRTGEGDEKKALVFLLPRHDLGAELLGRVRKARPEMRAAVVKGIDWRDPENPDDAMCLDPALPRAAMVASQPATSVCVACPYNGACGYTVQQAAAKDADVVLAAHNYAFQEKPSWIPDAGVVVFDEAFWPSGVKGDNALEPLQLAVSALLETRTGAVTGSDRERLLWLRNRAADALHGHAAGGLLREALVASGLTEENAGEWLALEWRTKPDVKITAAMGRDEVLDALGKAAEQGFTRRRPLLARYARELLAGNDARSVNATVVPDAALGGEQGSGPAVRFAWREDFAKWVAEAPKLILDATTHEAVVRAWAPDVEVVDIEVQAPGQRVHQIVGREFGRAFFTQCAGNVDRLADLVLVELAKATGTVLVILQAAVEGPLRDAIRRRLGGSLPNRLHLAHHGAITGLDAFRDAERLLVVGRPATDRAAGERLGELVKGAPVETVLDADDSRWPTVPAAIRMADGSGYPVRQPCHPDPLVEALRFSISEGAVVQAIGRGRGVRRSEDQPVFVTVLGEMALPLTVHEVATWEDAVPSRIEAAIASAVVMGWAMPFSPRGMAAAYPERWATPKAAEKDLERSDTPQVLIRDTHKRLGGILGHRLAEYRTTPRTRWSLALVPEHEGEAALAAALGELLYAFRLREDGPPPRDAAPRRSAPPPLGACANWERPPNAAPNAPAVAALADGMDIEATVERRLEAPVEQWGDESDALPFAVVPPPPALLRMLAARAGGSMPAVRVVALDVPDLEDDAVERATQARDFERHAVEFLALGAGGAATASLA